MYAYTYIYHMYVPHAHFLLRQAHLLSGYALLLAEHTYLSLIGFHSSSSQSVLISF